MKIRLALIRQYPKKGDLESNHQCLTGILEEITNHKPDLVITPECFLDGYVVTEAHINHENLEEYAVRPEDSKYTTHVADWASANSCWVIYGCSRKVPGGGVSNSAIIFDREGGIHGNYDKTHCPAHDRSFLPGNALPVFESDFGIFGVVICADRRRPECIRSLALQGARIVFNPTYGNYGEMNNCLMRTRSFENELFIAFTHPAQSLVTDPSGKTLLDDSDENTAFSICEVNLADANRRRARDNSFLKARRSDLYLR
jgi:predicted amidohydrolase